MDAIFNLVSSANKYINHPGRKDPRVMLLKSIAVYITKILKVFGLVEDADGIGYGGSGGAGGSSGVGEKYLDAFVHFRDQIRMMAREKGIKELLELCDSVRDDVFIELGVRVEDRNLADGQGSLWKLDDPAILKKEVEEKRLKQRQMAAQKRKNKIQKLTKDLTKWEGFAKSPTELFVGDEKYGKLDESTGLPLELKNGDPLSKKQSKNVAKEMDKYSGSHKQLQEKPGGAEAFLESLRKEIADLKLEE